MAPAPSSGALQGGRKGSEDPRDGGRGWAAVEDAWLDLMFPEKLKRNRIESSYEL